MKSEWTEWEEGGPVPKAWRKEAEEIVPYLMDGDMHPSTEAILKHFTYDHLPEHLQEISRPFCQMAHDFAVALDGPELTAGLRKLLEAKDCMVRAAIDSNG